MIEKIPQHERSARLLDGGLAPEDIASFLRKLDDFTARTNTGMEQEAAELAVIRRQSLNLLGALPNRSQRNARQKASGEVIQHLVASAARTFFLHQATTLYADVTKGGALSLRVDELLWRAAKRMPGVLPSKAELEVEGELMQKDKDGIEIVQGLFISQVMSHRASGLHLIRAMLRPLPESRERLADFIATGSADLGTIRVKVEGETGFITIHNERYLNAEDDTTVLPMEVAVDLVLLHPQVRMGVLRGSRIDHPKYQGRRVFCSGINLTRIYQGKQSYISFLYRNLGLHNKLNRGILPDNEIDSLDAVVDGPEETLEKLWVAVVETFAIGGGCQFLLLMDHVIAETGAYFSLPARKEGILPGAAPMRLPRFVGERLAREAILFDKVFNADTPEGRLIANEVVPREEIEDALRSCVENATGSGMVSAGANRKAIRVQTEPLDRFREYMATYARDQAFCHLSDQLIENLERHWNAKARKL